MQHLKADFHKRIDCALWSLSIDEAQALVSIASDITGIRVNVELQDSGLNVWVGQSYFSISAKPNSVSGSWNGESCTDSLILNPFPKRLHNGASEIDLSSGLRTFEFISLIMQKGILTLHNPIATKSNFRRDRLKVGSIVHHSYLGAVVGEVER
jgi:hypothetical protein